MGNVFTSHLNRGDRATFCVGYIVPGNSMGLLGIGKVLAMRAESLDKEISPAARILVSQNVHLYLSGFALGFMAVHTGFKVWRYYS